MIDDEKNLEIKSLPTLTYLYFSNNVCLENPIYPLRTATNPYPKQIALFFRLKSCFASGTNYISSNLSPPEIKIQQRHHALSIPQQTWRKTSFKIDLQGYAATSNQVIADQNRGQTKRPAILVIVGV